MIIIIIIHYHTLSYISYIICVLGNGSWNIVGAFRLLLPGSCIIVELAQTLALNKPALLLRTAASYKMVHGLGIYIFFLTYYFSV